jgi:hypothetical protein
MHRAGSFIVSAREFARYKLDLVGVQEVRWDKGGTVRAGDFLIFNMAKEMKIINWVQDICTCTPHNSINS